MATHREIYNYITQQVARTADDKLKVEGNHNKLLSGL